MQSGNYKTGFYIAEKTVSSGILFVDEKGNKASDNYYILRFKELGHNSSFCILPGDKIEAKLIRTVNRFGNDGYDLYEPKLVFQNSKFDESFNNKALFSFVTFYTVQLFKKNLSIRHFNRFCSRLESKFPDMDWLKIVPEMPVPANSILKLKKLVLELWTASKEKKSTSLSHFWSNRNGPEWDGWKNFARKTLGLKEMVIMKKRYNGLLPLNYNSAFSKANRINIFIDESWPIGEESGVIAGVVSNDGDSFDALPSRKTHNKENAREALDLLYNGNKVIPFIFRTNKKNYLKLISLAFKIILGYLLPSTGCACEVFIYFEKFSNFPPNTDKTEYFDGILSELKEAYPFRFRRWKLRSVKWCEKEFGHIPYGDLLAYYELEGSPNSSKLLDSFQIHQKMTYVNVSTDLIKKLDELNDIEKLTFESLTFFAEETSFGFKQRIFEIMKKKVHEDKNIQENLFRKLENFISRNKGKTEKVIYALEVFKRIFPTPLKVFTPRLRYFWFSNMMDLANHHGNPEQINNLLEQYLLSREDIMKDDLSLIADTDLSLVVHFNDLFDFNSAETINESLITNPRFESLPKVLKGKIQSSMGQCNSILCKFGEAEKNFQEAKRLISSSIIEENTKKKELVKTEIYRCINAFDGKLPNRDNCLNELLNYLGTSLANFDFKVVAKNSYFHHLFLRLCFESNIFDNKLIQDYFEVFSGDKIGKFHPWELIEFYRGLLICQNNNYKMNLKSNEHFQNAKEISLGNHAGLTLNFIGLVVLFVEANLSGKKQEFSILASTMLSKKTINSGEFGKRITKMQRTLISKASIEKKLSILPQLLPFNYR